MPGQTLYIMCGLPFAGKSTIARRLASQRGAEVVELDAVNAEFGTKPTTSEAWDQRYAECHTRLRALLVSGRSAIFDATNHTSTQRAALRRLAGEAGASAVVIYVPVERAEAERRWLENRMTAKRRDVTDEDFAAVVDSFEVPTLEESPLEVRRARSGRESRSN